MSRESDFYRENVAPEIDRRLLRAAALAMRVAQVESREFPDQELDAVPTFRRLNFHYEVLFGTYPGGVAVERQVHNGGCHVLVHSGAVTISGLTRSQVPWSVDFQPYQETLAAAGQLALGLPGSDAQQEDVNKLWALLIYGGNYRSPKLEHCRIMFPTREGEFAPGTIDLLTAYPDIVGLFNDEEYAQREALSFIEFRKQRRG